MILQRLRLNRLIVVNTLKLWKLGNLFLYNSSPNPLSLEHSYIKMNYHPMVNQFYLWEQLPDDSIIPQGPGN